MVYDTWCTNVKAIRMVQVFNFFIVFAGFKKFEESTDSPSGICQQSPEADGYCFRLFKLVNLGLKISLARTSA